MSKKKKNNAALRKVLKSKDKVELRLNQDRILIQQGYRQNRLDVERIKDSLVDNKKYHKNGLGMFYPEAAALMEALEKGVDRHHDKRKEVLECLITGLNFRGYQVEFLVNKIFEGVSYNQDNKIDLDLSIVRTSLNDSPLFTDIQKQDLKLMFTNLKLVVMYSDMTAISESEKATTLLFFKDVLVAFLSYGTSNYYYDKPRPDILDKVRTTLGHPFANELVSMYHTYSGYFDIEKLEAVLKKHEGVVSL